MLFCPFTYFVEIFASLAGVEIDEWFGVLGIDPDLAYHASVYRAHELLAEDIDTLCLEWN